jgi:hypothetical protein
MTPRKKGLADLRIPAGEEAAKEAFSEEREAAPEVPAGKASTVPADQAAGCSADTIEDGNGNYLEPPD